MRLVTLFSPGDPDIVFLSLHVDPSDGQMVLTTTEPVALAAKALVPGRWTHVALCFAKPRGKNTLLALVLDGTCAGTIKVGRCGQRRGRRVFAA